jgi:formylglycine-generating enzyme required for sulfatase activity
MNDLDTVTLAGGTFLMGSSVDERDLQVGRPMVRRESLDDEGPRHEVEISPFECMRYPVTRRLFAAVTNDDPVQRYFEFHQRMKDWPTAKLNEKPDACPVVWLRWLEAIQFCNALSRSKGLTPCYSISGKPSGVASNDAKVEWLRSSNGYRLPTEAEWEFACRAGTTTQWAHGDDASELPRYAWYDETLIIDAEWHGKRNLPKGVYEVGQKLPNPWGLFDMHGNVAEMCYDSPRKYAADRIKDPEGDQVNIYRAIRGGSAGSLVSDTRSASRNSMMRTKLSLGVGFRCVRSINSSSPLSV